MLFAARRLRSCSFTIIRAGTRVRAQKIDPSPSGFGRRAFSSVSAFSIMSSLRILDTSVFVRLGKGLTTRGRRRRPDLG